MKRRELVAEAKDDPVPLKNVDEFGEVVLDQRNKNESALREQTMTATLDSNPQLEYEGYQALVSRAVDVFGDEIVASRWLSMPCVDLNGDVPLRVAGEMAYDPARVKYVFEPIFVRIEHGIYY